MFFELGLPLTDSVCAIQNSTSNQNIAESVRDTDVLQPWNFVVGIWQYK